MKTHQRENIYVIPDIAITEFGLKASKELNPEKIEGMLMEFVQKHFQFKLDVE